MKLLELSLDRAVINAQRFIAEQLNESIVDYLGVIIAKLKNKKPDVLFNKTAPEIDLEHLSQLVGSIKILFNPNYRQALTRNEIDVNPNNPAELFGLLNSIDKMGHDPDPVKKTFEKLSKIARDSVAKTLAGFEDLKSTDDKARLAAIAELEKFNSKVGQLFNKIKTVAAQAKQTTQQSAQQMAMN